MIDVTQALRYAWALLRNQTDADDLVQDCLVRALDHMYVAVFEAEKI
jgi:DNA-directed RNA polymerase specialized sigma24 family protein